VLIPRLMCKNEKLECFSALGIGRVFDFDFSDRFHTMPPEDFARIFLMEAFSAKAVFCGFNFRFGADASGNPDTLKSFSKKYSFETHVIDPVYVADRVVSSSLIRRCINSGDVEPAGRLLGREYALTGVVEEGRKLGRVFGFPTANFFPDGEMTIPAYGVYVTEAYVNGTVYPSVSNIGICPTVNAGSRARIETHILDTDIELYNTEITVCFKKRLRKERRFENESSLKRQIASDVETARRYFGKIPPLHS